MDDVEEVIEYLDHELRKLNPSDRYAALHTALSNGSITVSIQDIPKIAEKWNEMDGMFGRFHQLPPVILEFLKIYLTGTRAKSVLDLIPGYGSILATVQTATNPSRSIAFTSSGRIEQLARVLNPTIEWRETDVLSEVESMDETFDVITGLLPFGQLAGPSVALPRLDGGKLEVRRELAFQLLAAGGMLLTETGVGIFVTTTNFIWSPHSPRLRLGEVGLGIEAILTLPDASFAPYTNTSTCLVLVRKKRFDDLFVGKVSDDSASLQILVENLKARQQGKSVEFGRLVNPSDFVGLDQLRLREQIKNIEKSYGAEAVPLSQLMTFSKRGGREEDFTFPSKENSIYVPTVGMSDVHDSPEKLTIKPQNYYQLQINPDKSDATFVARFLNSELGRSIRLMSQRGATIKQLSGESIKTMPVLVPPPQVQERILELEARIATDRNTLLDLQNTLSEFQSEIWQSTRYLERVDRRLAAFSAKLSVTQSEAEQSLKDWIETLPFPLASILRVWLTAPIDEYKDRYEHLLHFFEASVAFAGSILLSAFSVEPLRSEVKPILDETLERANASLKLPTMGTWRIIFEFLSSQTRKQMSGNETSRALAGQMFGDPSFTLQSALTRKEWVELLDTANQRRNQWPAHGGFVSRRESRLRHEELVELLSRFRKILGNGWEQVQLVRTLRSERVSGGWSNELSVLMGSNSAFERDRRFMDDWMEPGHIYIISRDTDARLELLPLVRLDSSPETEANAWYFYNGIRHEIPKFVSYHFPGDPPSLDGDKAVHMSLEELTRGWFTSS